MPTSWMFLRRRASALINDAGSLSALPSHTTEPSALAMQIETVFNDTSSPTNNAMRVSLCC